MKIILCKNKSLGSILLRLIMWSRWSHSAIYDDELDLVYDTTMWQGGVRVHSFSEWSKHYPSRELRPIEVLNKEDARVWLEQQLDKKYDVTALFAFPFRKDWQEDDAWFCSEMSESFRNLFSTPKFRAGSNRITPHHEDIIKD